MNHLNKGNFFAFTLEHILATSDTKLLYERCYEFFNKIYNSDLIEIFTVMMMNNPHEVNQGLILLYQNEASKLAKEILFQITIKISHKYFDLSEFLKILTKKEIVKILKNYITYDEVDEYGWDAYLLKNGYIKATDIPEEYLFEFSEPCELFRDMSFVSTDTYLLDKAYMSLVGTIEEKYGKGEYIPEMEILLNQSFDGYNNASVTKNYEAEFTNGIYIPLKKRGYNSTKALNIIHSYFGNDIVSGESRNLGFEKYLLDLENEQLSLLEKDVAYTLYNVEILRLENLVLGLQANHLPIKSMLDSSEKYFKVITSEINSVHFIDVVYEIIKYLNKKLISRLSNQQTEIIYGDGWKSLPYMVMDSFVAEDVKLRRLKLNQKLGIKKMDMPRCDIEDLVRHTIKKYSNNKPNLPRSSSHKESDEDEILKYREYDSSDTE